jgi:hypothetical protein
VQPNNDLERRHQETATGMQIGKTCEAGRDGPSDCLGVTELGTHVVIDDEGPLGDQGPQKPVIVQLELSGKRSTELKELQTSTGTLHFAVSRRQELLTGTRHTDVDRRQELHTWDWKHEDINSMSSSDRRGCGERHGSGDSDPAGYVHSCRSDSDRAGYEHIGSDLNRYAFHTREGGDNSTRHSYRLHEERHSNSVNYITVLGVDGVHDVGPRRARRHAVPSGVGGNDVRIPYQSHHTLSWHSTTSIDSFQKDDRRLAMLPDNANHALR